MGFGPKRALAQEANCRRPNPSPQRTCSSASRAVPDSMPRQAKTSRAKAKRSIYIRAHAGQARARFPPSSIACDALIPIPIPITIWISIQLCYVMIVDGSSSHLPLKRRRLAIPDPMEAEPAKVFSLSLSVLDLVP